MLAEKCGPAIGSSTETTSLHLNDKRAGLAIRPFASDAHLVVVASRSSGLLTSAAAEDETCQCEDQENNEQDLGDTCRTGCDAAEAEQGGDQRDDEEDDGVVQHAGSFECSVRKHRDCMGCGVVKSVFWGAVCVIDLHPRQSFSKQALTNR